MVHFKEISKYTGNNIRKLQQEDKDIGSLLQAVEEQQKPSQDTCQGKSRTFQLFLQQWQQLYIVNGLLFRHYKNVNGTEKWKQLVVPRSLQKEVLHSLHNGISEGHLGEDKTLNKL